MITMYFTLNGMNTPNWTELNCLILKTIGLAGKFSTENIVVDNDEAAADQRTSSWSMPSTSRLRCDIQLTKLRGTSRSASDIHEIPDRAGTHSAADMSLRLSGCGAERSIKAKRRVIKVTDVVAAPFTYLIT